MLLNPEDKAEFLSAIRAEFGTQQGHLIGQLVELVFDLQKQLQDMQSQPLALEWVSPEQAGILVKRSAPTVRKLARAGAFKIGNNPGYQKGQRKMEYYLPGIREYLFRQNLKQEAIEARKREIGK